MSIIEQKAEALENLVTVGDWVRWCESSLEAAEVYLGHGTDNYWDEALLLVFTILALPLDADASILDTDVLPTERGNIFAAIVARIDERIPLPYVTGQAWFMGMPYFVDERVLIPRSPVGEWIERRFAPWLDAASVRRICDIGTGSGCIAIGCAMAFPEAQVDAVDICPDALAVAQKNIEHYNLCARVHCVQGDALHAVAGQRYDLIISNPPYVPIAEQELLPKEYQHEPAGALFSGDSGLDIVGQMLNQAANCLSDDGVLVIEVGQTAVNLVEQRPDLPFVWLDCERGGEGVLLLTKEQLMSHTEE